MPDSYDWVHGTASGTGPGQSPSTQAARPDGMPSWARQARELADRIAETPPERIKGNPWDQESWEPRGTFDFYTVLDEARWECCMAAGDFDAHPGSRGIATASSRGMTELVRAARRLLPAAQKLRREIESVRGYLSPQADDALVRFVQAGQEQMSAAARHIESCADQLLTLIHSADPIPELDHVTRMVPPERPAVTARRVAGTIRGTRWDLPVTSVPFGTFEDRHSAMSQALDKAAASFDIGDDGRGRRTAASAARRLAELAERTDPRDAWLSEPRENRSSRAVNLGELAGTVRRLAAGNGPFTGAGAIRQIATDIHASPSGASAADEARLLDIAAQSLGKGNSHLAMAILADTAAGLARLGEAASQETGRLQRTAAAADGTPLAAEHLHGARLERIAADDLTLWTARVREIQATLLIEAPRAKNTVQAPAARSAIAHRATSVPRAVGHPDQPGEAGRNRNRG